MATNPPTALGVGYGPLQDGPLTDYGAVHEPMLDLMPLVLGADMAALAASETAGDFFRNIGTNQAFIDGEATVNETEASVGWAIVTLPANYVSGGPISIRVKAGVVLAGDAALTSATIDFSAYKQAEDGTVGSDLVTTAATAITTTFDTYEFVITPTGLSAGDVLVIKMTTSVVETAGGTGAANSRITALQLVGDIDSDSIVVTRLLEDGAVSTDKIQDGAVTNAKVSASAAIARSKLAEDALAAHGIPLTSVRGATGLALTATETAGGFNVSVSTNVLVLQAEVTDNETETSVCIAEYVLPDNYVAEGDITVRLRAALIKSGSPTDNGSTLDLSVYKQGDAAVGSDLCATAAATFAALDTWYNKDFTVTATGLAAGDRLTLKITYAVIDSEAGAGTIIGTLAGVTVLADVKG